MASLVGARIDVTGKGPGKVEDFSKVLTGGSLHTINFDDGSKEKILLARMKLGSPNGGAEFTVIEEAEAEPSLVYGVAPTFKNSPVKPNALAVAAWKWAKPWALELDDTEIEALPEELKTSTREIRALFGRRNVAYPMPVGSYSVTVSKSFKPRPTDVIVLTFHKTGTTWCQQITHQLRTKGHTDFEEITQVMPWIDFAWEVNQDLAADQMAEPRLFKSHARLSAVQEGCKYLCTVRDPVKTLISLFNFFTGKFMSLPNGPPFPAEWLTNVDNFAKCPLWAIDSIWGGNYWEYMTEFYLARKQPSVKLLCFESMLADLPNTVREVANFMALEKPDAALVDEVVRLSSKTWMASNDAKFSEGWFYDEQIKHNRYDAPPLPPVAKVTQASETPAVEPSEETVAWMQAQWTALAAPKTGCKDYAEMRATLEAESKFDNSP